MTPRLVATAAALTGVLAPSAVAANISVTTLSDPAGASCPGAQCSLRAAVAAAAPNDVVVLPAQGGTFVLTQGAAITNNSPITIQGAGAKTTIIDASGNGPNSAFILSGGNTITGVTIENTQSSAVVSNGNITVNNDVFHDNTSPGGGGAVNEVFGTITAKGSLFYNNTAGTAASGADGGALYNQTGSGSLGFVVADSTFTNNHAIGPNAHGGAIAMLAGDLTLTNDTFSDNTAVAGGGGIMQEAGTLNNHATLTNVILSSNTSTAGGANCDRTGGGDFIITANSIVSGGTTGCTRNTSPGNTPSTASPHLSALADNGGQTMTMAITSSSPAKDAGMAAGTLSDQRGVARPQGATKDVGAFELVQNKDVGITMTGSDPSVVQGTNITYTVHVMATALANDGDRPIVSDALPANVSFVSATPTQGDCTGTVNVTCHLGLLGNNQSATIILVVTATGGDVGNSATLSTSRPDSNASNNVAIVPTTVTAAPAPPPPPGGGQQQGSDPQQGGSAPAPTPSVVAAGAGAGNVGPISGPVSGKGKAPSCKVPRVTGLSVKGARKRLRRAGCKGKLRLKGHARKGHAPKVRKQLPRKGKSIAARGRITLVVR